MSTSAPIAAAKHAASAAIRCAASRIQAKIAVGRSNDAYEQEADRVAETVVSHETTTESRAAAAAPGASGRAVATISRLQRLRRQEEKEEPQVSARLESSLQSTRGGGSALPGNVRSEMEPSIGADFSNVRVHTGAAAVQMNRELNAQAFTHGPNVYFNEGKYDSGSRQGKRLLAHELTHTVQQGASPRTNAAVASTGGLRIQRGIWDAVSGFVGSVGRGIQAIGQGIANLGRAALDALLGRLGKYAKDEFPGYDLLAVVLGRDPITQQEVPRTATNLVRGVMSLVPGGKEKFNQLHESGALTRAFDWIRKKLVKLGLTWTKIRETFSLAWNSLSPEDAFHPIAAFKRIMRIFSPMINGLFKFAKAVFGKILEFIFEGFLGPGAAKVLKILRRAGSVLINIIRHPVDFIQNLVKGVRGGIDLFVTNIKKHLIAGLVTWLTGAMADVPITLPEKWDLKGIIHLVLQILGLTWDRIRQKLVKRLGEKVVKIAETSVDVIKRLVTEGPIALWEMIKEKAAEIQQKAMDGIRDWVITKVVKQAIIKLVSFLNPAGAFIQAILAIYNTIMFFVENWQRIVTFVQTVFNAIADIAKGKVAKVAQAVERGMAMAIPIILNFLARLIGLSGIGKAVSNVIEKIRKPIDKVVDKVIDTVAMIARKLLRKKGNAPVEPGKPIVQRVSMSGQPHVLKVTPGRATKVFFSNRDIIPFLGKVKGDWKKRKPTNSKTISALTNIEIKAKKVQAAAQKSKPGLEQGPEISEMKSAIIRYAQQFQKNEISSGNEMRERIKQLQISFNMGKKGHSIYFEEQGGKLEIVMASNAAGILYKKIVDAESEVKALIKDGKKKTTGGGTWQNVLKALENRRIETGFLLDYVFHIEAGKRGYAFEALNGIVKKISTKLEKLGKTHGIESLVGIWKKEHPSQFVLGGRIDLSHEKLKKKTIREVFYPGMSVLLSYRNGRLNTQFGMGVGLQDPSDKKRFLSEAKYSEEEPWHPTKTVVGGIHYASVPRNKAGIDHFPVAVVENWNSVGHNQTQAERADWFKDKGNLRLISRQLNSSLGGAEKSKYKPDVGENFRGPGE